VKAVEEFTTFHQGQAQNYLIISRLYFELLINFGKELRVFAVGILAAINAQD
jgi:hypothetical protein